MEGMHLRPEDKPSGLSFRVCLQCRRAVPSESDEHYCINDGTKMLECCPKCDSSITSPYALFCGACGHAFRNEQPKRTV
jgi:hypothetical protein